MAVNNVELRIIDRDVEHDVGIGSAKAGQERVDHHLHGEASYGETQHAGRRVAERGKRFNGVVEFIERRMDLPQQLIAGLGQGNAPRRAVEEAHAEPLLERADRLAHGRC